MKHPLIPPILIGFCIALAGTLLMLILLVLQLVGPKSIPDDRLMYGGTILFVSLYLFLLFGIFYGLRNAKKRAGDTFSFRSALLTGTIISLATGVFSVLFTLIFYELIYPDYLPEMVAAIREKLIAQGVGPEAMQQQLEEQSQYYQTGMQAGFSMIGNTVSGLAFTVFLGLFVRKRKT